MSQQQSRTTTDRQPRWRVAVALAAAFLLSASLPGVAAQAHYQPGEPPGVDPGTPPFVGLASPMPAEPAAFDPTRNQLQADFDADVAAGGTSYWFDRILARPFSNAPGETSLLTRGRALYMYTHNPPVLGFAGTGGLCVYM
jgi:hypothetical protein